VSILSLDSDCELFSHQTDSGCEYYLDSPNRTVTKPNQIKRNSKQEDNNPINTFHYHFLMQLSKQNKQNKNPTKQKQIKKKSISHHKRT
jgi:hypothetical protein